MVSKIELQGGNVSGKVEVGFENRCLEVELGVESGGCLAKIGVSDASWAIFRLWIFEKSSFVPKTRFHHGKESKNRARRSASPHHDP